MESLVEKAKNGDKQSFSRLINTIQIELYNIAKVKLNNEDDVKDVLQDTILDIYKDIKKLKDNNFFKTWSVRILINNCNTVLKAKYKTKNLISIDEYMQNYEETSNNVDKIFSKLNYEDVINMLSVSEKMVFVLYYQEDYKIKEISEILNIKENTIKSILKRGRDKIKASYKEDSLYE